MSTDKQSRGFYAGSFDPITRGHFDIIRQALAVFDHITIAVGQNPKKTRLFPFEEARALIRAALYEEGVDPDRVTISAFTGSLKNAVLADGSTSIVRGLRQVSDFNDEFSLHGAMERSVDIPMVYFICHHEFLHVSSSTARELASLGEPTDWLVHKAVALSLMDKFAEIA